MTLASGRAAARRRMRAQVRVERADGAPVTDADGNVVQAVTVVWAGSARVAYPDVQSRRFTPGAGQAAMLRPVVSLPAEVDAVRRGDIVVVVTSPLDAGLIGRRYQVAAVAGGEVTARRLECEEVQ